MVNGEGGLFDRVTEEAIRSSCELVPGGTQQPAISKAATLGNIKEPVGRGQSLKQETGL